MRGERYYRRDEVSMVRLSSFRPQITGQPVERLLIGFQTWVLPGTAVSLLATRCCPTARPTRGNPRPRLTYVPYTEAKGVVISNVFCYVCRASSVPRFKRKDMILTKFPILSFYEY